MATITLEINTDTSAFTEDPSFEIASILRNAADLVEDGREDFKLRDYNGNTVGSVSFSE